MRTARLLATCLTALALLLPPTSRADALAPAKTDSLAGIFTATSARGANSIWSVGYTLDGTRPLAEHWNGTSWHHTHPIVPAGSSRVQLTGVVSFKRDRPRGNRAFAVGSFTDHTTGPDRALIESFSSEGWRLSDAPSPPAATASYL